MTFKKCTWRQDKKKFWVCGNCNLVSEEQMTSLQGGNGYCMSCGREIKEYIQYEQEENL